VHSLPNHFTTLAGLLDVIIFGVLLEGVVLVWAWRRTRRRPSPWELVCMLGAGLCLMLALRLSVAEAHMAWVACLLATSGLVHALDLHLRRRHDARPVPEDGSE
jgi:hypothetical protein